MLRDEGLSNPGGNVMKLSAIVMSAVLVVAVPFAAEAVIHHFTVASIDGAQETPPNGSTSTGSGTFTLDTATGIATAGQYMNVGKVTAFYGTTLVKDNDYSHYYGVQ